MVSSIGRVACAALLVAGSAGMIGTVLQWEGASDSGGGRATGPAGTSRTRLLDAFAGSPLSFEPNLGQAGPDVGFVSRGNGYVLSLAPGAATLALGDPQGSRPGLSLGMRLVGANVSDGVGLRELSGTVNYFLGDDPTGWITDVPTYEQVIYPDVYRGIDLLFHGSQQRLEYDLIVAPGADPGSIRLSFTGAGTPHVNRRGDLVFRAPGGDVRWLRPLVFQRIEGTKQQVRGSYVVTTRGRVGFRLGAYDPARRLVIDPVLAYSTYLGGARSEEGVGIAVDASGNAYVTGTTPSADFPTANAYDGSLGGTQDGYVAKLDPTGGSLIFSTYLGGSGSDTGRGVAVDASGYVYLAGATGSTDFPTVNPYQSSLKGGLDAYVSKLDPTGGSLVYSTYLGGGSSDGKPNIAIDTSGSAYVVGFTFSRDFPTVGPFQSAHGGGADGFVTKLAPAGSSLVFSTYLGGGQSDTARGVAVDGAGNVYVTGFAYSTNFPTVNAVQGSLGGDRDAFVTKLNATGGTAVYSTYLGGSAQDSSYRGHSIGVDATGNAYVTGFTESANFPTVNPIQGTSGGGRDAYVAGFTAAGAFIYSSYLGGSGDEEGNSIAVDGSGNAYVTGYTASTNFPTVAPVQGTSAGGTDVFVSKLDPTGGTLVFSTYLGGRGREMGQGIAIDASGNAYVTGFTASTNFPTVNPVQGQRSGARGNDSFVAKLTL